MCHAHRSTGAKQLLWCLTVKMKVTMAPLLNLWCDDLLVQQLIKCFGNGILKLFMTAFVCLRVYLVFYCFSVQS